MSEYHVIIAPAERIAAELGVALEHDTVVRALDQAGYVRLDGRGEENGMLAFMQKAKGVASDDGHRAEALDLARALIWIARADGPLDTTGMTRIAEQTMALAPTDDEGRRMILALASYARNGDRPQGVPQMPSGFTTPTRLARAACQVAGNLGVSTDLAMERAAATGRDIPRWDDILWKERPPIEPLVRLRRHDPSRYERMGMAADLAEIMSWVEMHPTATGAMLEHRATALGIDRSRLASGIIQARALMASEDEQPD